MRIQVTNLATGRSITYIGVKGPMSAVVAAHAQEDCDDYNTWDYSKYAPKIEIGRKAYTVGNWCVLKEQPPPWSRS